MKRQNIRLLISTLFLIAGLLLFALLMGNILKCPAHTFCPYATVCFGAFALRPDIHRVFFPGAWIFGGVVILSALLAGRAFCGYICPLGTLQEQLSRRHRQRAKDILGRTLHRWLGALKYIVLVVTLELAWAGLLRVYLGACPVFSLAHPQGIMLVGGIVLGFILLGGFLIERLFCRYLCPFGALLSVFAFLGNLLHTRRWKINRHYRESLKCGNCPNYCPMGIDMGEGESISSPDCIACGRCIRRCMPGERRECIYGRIAFPAKSHKE